MVSAGRSLFSLRAEETSGGSVALSSRKNLTRYDGTKGSESNKKNTRNVLWGGHM